MLAMGTLPWSRHLARSTPWHRADPRVRLLATMVLSCLALASRTWTELALVFLALTTVYGLSRTRWRTAWSGFRSFFFLLLFTAFLQLFLTPGKPLPGFSTSGGLTITYEGLRLSVLLLLRLSAVILLSTHLVATTSPLELSRSLGWFFLPGGRLGLPVGDLVLLFNLGFQFFPLLLEESQSLRLALESRGISLRHPRLSYRFQALTAWILALLTALLERAHRLAMALEMKNFGHRGILRLRFPSWGAESSAGLALTIISAALWVALRLSPSFSFWA
ncbi:energy-coupling factor transporter transmembrane protein EcfT [bacterium]|nr:energy-coupling factor transporter transmembrane protein EcfT [bacterium]